MYSELLNRVVVGPEVMRGKPVIRGTRIPVDLLVRMVAQRISDAEIRIRPTKTPCGVW